MPHSKYKLFTPIFLRSSEKKNKYEITVCVYFVAPVVKSIYHYSTQFCSLIGFCWCSVQGTHTQGCMVEVEIEKEKIFIIQMVISFPQPTISLYPVDIHRHALTQHCSFFLGTLCLGIVCMRERDKKHE